MALSPRYRFYHSYMPQTWHSWYRLFMVKQGHCRYELCACQGEDPYYHPPSHPLTLLSINAARLQCWKNGENLWGSSARWAQCLLSCQRAWSTQEHTTGQGCGQVWCKCTKWTGTFNFQLGETLSKFPHWLYLNWLCQIPQRCSQHSAADRPLMRCHCWGSQRVVRLVT